LAFDEAALPTITIPRQTLDQLKRLDGQLDEKDEKLSIVLADKENLDAEIERDCRSFMKPVLGVRVLQFGIANAPGNAKPVSDRFDDLGNAA